MGNYGGSRKGAGRPKKALVIARKVLAADVLQSVDEAQLWRDLLTGPDIKIRLDALKYLTDRRDGKAPQSIEHTGPEGRGFRVIVEHIGRPQRPEDQATA